LECPAGAKAPAGLVLVAILRKCERSGPISRRAAPAILATDSR
jgi:hypothetical protein